MLHIGPTSGIMVCSNLQEVMNRRHSGEDLLSVVAEVWAILSYQRCASTRLSQLRQDPKYAAKMLSLH